MFFQKIGLSYTTSLGLLASCQNSDKSNDPIPRKYPASQMVEGNDGQTLFHRILPATAGGLTGTTTVDWHLKVKDIENDVCLTKNYCITVSIQKISSIHTLIQQILGSHKLNGHAHQKISEIFIYLSIYLPFIYSWQSLIIYYNRVFFEKKRLAFTIVFFKAN